MPGPGGGPGLIKEGPDAAAAVAAEQRRTTSRRDLQQRHASFGALSPETGQLDMDAVEAGMAADAEETLALLADAAGATDERLRALAGSAAARIVLDFAAPSRSARGHGAARLRTSRLPDTGGDIDLDASLEGLAAARAGRRPADPGELRGRLWHRPDVGLCLLIDRSGSMGGERLATAAVAASAVALRAALDFSVVAFGEDAVIVKGQRATRPPADVVGDLIALRGHGPTDLALGLRAAAAQLAWSPAGRRLVIVMSDCRATAGDDPVVEALALPEVAVMAPAADAADARSFADATGSTFTVVHGPASVPEAFAALLDR